MKTAELHRRLGCSNNTLHRLVERGILAPTRIEGGPGTARHGDMFDWDDSESRASSAVVRLLRSHLMDEVRSPTSVEARDDCLRSVAAAARVSLPSELVPRWLILLPDGSCARGDDWLAAAMVDHRTLIPLQEIAAGV
jgi:hypothetical protein